MYLRVCVNYEAVCVYVRVCVLVYVCVCVCACVLTYWIRQVTQHTLSLSG